MQPGNLIGKEIAEKYGNRVRIRVCGLCWKDNSLMLVKHTGLIAGNFWAPPGGGVEFEQGATDALIREFKEETSVTIKPGNLLFTVEFIKPPLHAIELFFEAMHVHGDPKAGHDPESAPDKQIIREVKYMDYHTILSMPADERHGIFQLAKTLEDLKNLRGFYRI